MNFLKSLQSKMNRSRLSEIADLAARLAADRLQHDGLRGLYRDIQSLGRMLRCGLSGRYSVPWNTLVLIGAGLAYLFNPADGVPDVIPVAGYADDATVICWILKIVQQFLDSFCEWEERQA